MARSLKAELIQLIARNMRSVEISKGMIILKPTDHIVRGFLLEGSAYKGVFYAWAMVVPLFGIMQNVSLNYSRRIIFGQNRSEKIETDEQRKLETALFLTQLFEKHYIDDLSEIRTPHDFVIKFPIGDMFIRPNMAFEYAVALCLEGDTVRGKSMLESIADLAGQSPLHKKVISLSKKILTDLRNGRNSFMTSIRSIEVENSRTHFPGISLVKSED